MSRLTWQNVSAPRGNAAAQVLVQNARTMGASFTGLGRAMADFGEAEAGKRTAARNEEIRENSNRFMLGLSSITDRNQLEQLAASDGGLAGHFGVDPSLLSSTAISAGMDRRRNLITNNENAYDFDRKSTVTDPRYDAEYERKESNRILNETAQNGVRDFASSFVNQDAALNAIANHPEWDAKTRQAYGDAIGSLPAQYWQVGTEAQNQILDSAGYQKRASELTRFEQDTRAMTDPHDGLNLFIRAKTGELSGNKSDAQLITDIKTATGSIDLEDADGHISKLLNRMTDSEAFKTSGMSKQVAAEFMLNNLEHDWLLKRGDQKVQLEGDMVKDFGQFLEQASNGTLTHQYNLVAPRISAAEKLRQSLQRGSSAAGLNEARNSDVLGSKAVDAYTRFDSVLADFGTTQLDGGEGNDTPQTPLLTASPQSPVGGPLPEQIAAQPSSNAVVPTESVPDYANILSGYQAGGVTRPEGTGETGASQANALLADLTSAERTSRIEKSNERTLNSIAQLRQMVADSPWMEDHKKAAYLMEADRLEAEIKPKN